MNEKAKKQLINLGFKEVKLNPISNNFIYWLHLDNVTIYVHDNLNVGITQSNDDINLGDYTGVVQIKKLVSVLKNK